jgi:16S rRNA C967 or C1407 C5-methylase (RsmB/RsmF family)
MIKAGDTRMCKKMPIFKTLQTLQGEIIIRLVELVKPNCVEVVVFSHCTQFICAVANQK